MKKQFLKISRFNLWISILILYGLNLCAQDKQAKIELSFSESDSVKTCLVKVTSDTLLVKGVDIHFYAKRLFSLLPIGKKAVATNDEGMTKMIFPNDLPGDTAGNIIVIAKIEDDDDYGTIEAKGTIKWGVGPPHDEAHWGERSLSAARDKAPMYLIISSVVIIGGVWMTIGYVVVQLFRIKKVTK